MFNSHTDFIDSYPKKEKAMRKILYITFANEESATGGGQCAGRNLESIQCLLGKENVVDYILSPKKDRSLIERLSRFVGVIKGYMGGLTDEHVANIMKMIDDGGFTDVFIDNSQLGSLAKLIRSRRSDIRIFTFFHNIEQDYMRSVTVESGDYKHAFWIRGGAINEKDACRYSDCVIALNRKDSLRMAERYSREADAVIPITMKDNYHDISQEQLIPCSKGGTKEVFFLGSYFPGNVKGLKWFCEEVLPEVDIHFTIAGAGMDAFAKDITLTDKITLYSFVDDLTSLYENADFVLLPIISGGGMKVKTAESLKYGKFLIGTPEAFEGYDINDEIASVCTSKEEFIRQINAFCRPYKYNMASRELFKKNHSFDVSLETFKNILAV